MTAVNGDVAIWGPLFNGSPVEVRTGTRWGGGIYSVLWNGKQFLWPMWKGAGIQTAIEFDGGGETQNPTEQGAAADQDGIATSTSLAQVTRPSDNQVSTACLMAYWLPYGGKSLSDTAFWKTATVGWGGHPNVIRYSMAYKLAAAHASMITEICTGYLTNEFNQFYVYDLDTKTLKSIPTDGEEKYKPIILANADGSYAMGVWGPGMTDMNHVYYAKDFTSAGEPTCKWSMVYKYPQAVSAGMYGGLAYMAVGTLADVQATITALAAGDWQASS